MLVIYSHDPAVMTSLSGDRKIARMFGRFFAQFRYETKRTQYCYMPDSWKITSKKYSCFDFTIVKVRCLSSHAGTFFSFYDSYGRCVMRVNKNLSLQHTSQPLLWINLHTPFVFCLWRNANAYFGCNIIRFIICFNRCMYSVFANSCPLQTDTFLFPLIHSHNVILSSNKF